MWWHEYIFKKIIKCVVIYKLTSILYIEGKIKKYVENSVRNSLGKFFKEFVRFSKNIDTFIYRSTNKHVIIKILLHKN